MHDLPAIAKRLGLLADDSALRGIAGGFQGKQAEVDAAALLLALVIGIAGFVGLWALARWVTRQDRSDSYYHPEALFRSLCRAHQLGRRERRLLEELARWHELDQPAILFLAPERFDPEGLSGSLRQQTERLLAIRARLFTEPNQRDFHDSAGPVGSEGYRADAVPAASGPSEPVLLES